MRQGAPARVTRGGLALPGVNVSGTPPGTLQPFVIATRYPVSTFPCFSSPVGDEFTGNTGTKRHQSVAFDQCHKRASIRTSICSCTIHLGDVGLCIERFRRALPRLVAPHRAPATATYACHSKQQTVLSKQQAACEKEHRGGTPPIPASRCALHTATLAFQWWIASSLFPPSIARGIPRRLGRSALAASYRGATVAEARLRRGRGARQSC